MSEFSIPKEHAHNPNARHNFLPNHDGLMITPTGERFWLSNRPWDEVNVSLGELPGLAIDYKLENTVATQEVIVLDIGSGSRSIAMSQLRERFAQATRKPIVAGIDLTNRFTIATPPNKLVADATRLPLKDACIDIAYSHQSLSLIGDSSNDPKRRESLQPALDEAVRVLRPGGIFIVDLNIAYDRGFSAQHGLKKLRIPPDTQAYWGHTGPKDRAFATNFILTAVIKHGAANDTHGLIDALGLQPDRKVET